MSEEFKTLKDFYFLDIIEYSDNNIHAENRIKDNLRQEAIKILNSDTIELCKYLNVGTLSQRELFILDCFIKKFNNLTKEDLQ